MKRRELFAGAGFSLMARAARWSSRKPNIMLVFTDQQTCRAMSCAGNPLLQAPQWTLAAQGVRFETAYTAFPVCGPARGTLLTGRRPHQHGVEWNERGLAKKTPTLGNIFREAGYRTVWAGKWHLDESYPLRKGSRQAKIADF
jgi:arylsulfatase A-like enzyme